MFGSCHLTIYEPSFFIRYSAAVVTLAIFTLIGVTLIIGYLWMIIKRNKKLKRMEGRRVMVKRDGNNINNALSYDVMDNKKRK